MAGYDISVSRELLPGLLGGGQDGIEDNVKSNTGATPFRCE